MTAPTLTIRPGMDVYNAYQDRYIGSVISVVRIPTGSASGGPQGGGPNPTGSETAPANPTLTHEQGGKVDATSPDHRGTPTLGEEMGPVPTIALGNTGPTRQSAADQYATHPDIPAPDVTHMAVRPGRLNLGPLSPLVYVPIEAVRSLSMERVVIEVNSDELRATWKIHPKGDVSP